jgi:chaperonin GroES
LVKKAHIWGQNDPPNPARKWRFKGGQKGISYKVLTRNNNFCIVKLQNTNLLLGTEDDLKVKPLLDRVIVKLEKSETKSAGGIIIPDTAQEKTQIGVVIAVGDDTEKIKVKAGEKVMYDKYAGTQVKVGGEEHLILKMADILAVIE